MRVLQSSGGTYFTQLKKGSQFTCFTVVPVQRYEVLTPEELRRRSGLDVADRRRLEELAAIGTQSTRFTGTKVHILTKNWLLQRPRERSAKR